MPENTNPEPPATPPPATPPLPPQSITIPAAEAQEAEINVNPIAGRTVSELMERLNSVKTDSAKLATEVLNLAAAVLDAHVAAGSALAFSITVLAPGREAVSTIKARNLRSVPAERQEQLEKDIRLDLNTLVNSMLFTASKVSGENYQLPN